MNISFDLDGVVADGHRFNLCLVNGIYLVDEALAMKAELEYYRSRPLLMHPNNMLAEGDTGYIITSRKPYSEDITRKWLKRHGILCDIVFADHADTINWKDDPEASIKAARLKMQAILDLHIDVHIDNNPTIIQTMRKVLPATTAILVGGER